MAPSIPSLSTHYALVVDAGSSGSRLQIYSWRDPGLERDEILTEVRAARKAGLGDGTGTTKSRWWWWDSLKGKGKATAAEMERRALRRLVRVGKGAKGDDWVKRVEPGISSLSPDDIPAYLSPLMDHALAHVPPSQQGNTPVYVLATAGMRLLSKEAQDALLQETCDTLRRDYPFKLPKASEAGPCGENVRIISGEEEGIWGWVAVNYLMDGFGHAPELKHDNEDDGHDHLLPLPPLASAPEDSSNAFHAVTPVDVHKHSPTFGFLDMGGASTQLAFAPTPEELSRSNFPASELATISLRLLSGEIVEWPVFAASWLGFGTNRVRERYVDQAIAGWQSAGGASATTSVDDVCLPVGLTLSSQDKAKHPDFVGTGNFSQCLDALKPLLKHDEPCEAHSHCLFGGMATPQIDFHRQDQRGFIGISEYWYTAHQVLGLGGVWDWAEWERGMGDFCAQEWADIEAKVKQDEGWNGEGVELSRLQMQCFKGAWISNVLHEGIGVPRLTDKGGNDTLTGNGLGSTNSEAEFRAQQKGLFQSMDTVRNTAISWTLGKVVIEASRSVGHVSAGWGPVAAVRTYMTTVPPLLLIGYVCAAAVILGYACKVLRRGKAHGTSPRRRRAGVANGWLPSWLSSTDSAEYYAEEGVGALTGLDTGYVPSKRRAGRWRIWGRRVSAAVRRSVGVSGVHHHEPRRPLPRAVSMPMGAFPPAAATATGWAGVAGSSPPSPRGAARSASMMDFTNVSLTDARTPPLPHSGASSSVASTPRPPPRPRQTSYSVIEGNGAASATNVPASVAGGWNDPPMSLFAHGHGPSTPLSAPLPNYDSSSGADDDWPAPHRKKTLRKKRSGGGLGLGLASGHAADNVLSRNSSRVNLSEAAHLAQRTSRAQSPMSDF